MEEKRLIREEFQVHKLNEEGMARAGELAAVMSHCLNEIERIVGGADGREMALVRTFMQEASFFAKRALAVRQENQIIP